MLVYSNIKIRVRVLNAKRNKSVENQKVSCII